MSSTCNDRWEARVVYIVGTLLLYISLAYHPTSQHQSTLKPHGKAYLQRHLQKLQQLREGKRSLPQLQNEHHQTYSSRCGNNYRTSCRLERPSSCQRYVQRRTSLHTKAHITKTSSGGLEVLPSKVRQNSDVLHSRYGAFLRLAVCHEGVDQLQQWRV